MRTGVASGLVANDMQEYVLSTQVHHFPTKWLLYGAEIEGEINLLPFWKPKIRLRIEPEDPETLQKQAIIYSEVQKKEQEEIKKASKHG